MNPSRLRFSTTVVISSILLLFLAGCPEPEPPSVTGTIPSSNAQDVSRDVQVKATFGEAMDSSTFTSSTFTLSTEGGQTVSGTVAYSGLSATLTPAASLDSGATYTARVSGSVKSAAGAELGEDYTWSFTTSEETESDPPTVTSVEPSKDATDVSVDTVLVVTFSEELSDEAVTQTSVALYDAYSGAISGQVTHTGATIRFTPSASLDPGVRHTAVVSGTVKDLAGNPMGSNYVWAFTTGVVADDVPPTVESTTPADGATDVATDIEVQVLFDEPMTSSTLSGETFTLTDSEGGAVEGSVAYGNKMATFTPSWGLATGTTYTATVTTGAQDLAGNGLAEDYVWSFTTETASDTEAPTVRATLPSADAADIAINTLVQVEFSESMDADTVSAGTFTVTDGAKAAVAGTVSYSGRIATFAPSASFGYATTYTATVTTGVADLAGNALAADYVWSFTTGDSPDNAAPEVASVVPADGAESVEVDASVSVSFNEAMDGESFTAETFYLESPDKGLVSGTVSYSEQTATLVPASTLAEATTYTATVTTGVTDLARNGLAENYTWSFTTKETGETDPPSVASTTPVTAATDVAVSTAVTATFSEALAPTSVTEDTFAVYDADENMVDGTVTYSGLTATFTPSQDLAYQTYYTALISENVRDVAGNSMTMPYEWTFTTEEAPDTTAPTVTEQIPANGATDVAVTAISLGARFSEAIDPATVTSDTFFVVDGSKALVEGEVSYSDQLATFVPAQRLADGATYTATVTTGITDLVGNALESTNVWSFTTRVPVETDPPGVASTNPAADATDVAVASAVTVTFDEAMDASTIDATTVLLYGPSAEGVAAQVAFDGTTVATLTPDAALAYESVYTVYVSTSVRDVAGNTMEAAYESSFTTEDAPDTTAPEVTSTAPANSTADVEVDTLIRAWFSEAIDPASLNAESFLVDDGVKGAVSGTIAYGDEVAIFTPGSLLPSGATVTVTLTSAVTDTSGNGLAEPYTWAFTTKEESETQPPSVVSTSPASEAIDVSANGAITVTFSEAMDPSTIGATALVLYDAKAGLVSGEVTYSDLVVTLTPTEPLQYNTLHSAVMSGDVQDLAGNSMGTSYIWAFTTEEGPDTTAPAAVSTAPEASATAVEVDAVVQVTFDEALDPATVTTDTFTLADSSKAPVSGTVAFSGVRATFTPSAPLSGLTTYTATATAGMADLAGNHLAEDLAWTFTTADVAETQPPSVASTDPASDATGVSVDSVISVTFSEAMNPETISATSFVLYDATTGLVSGQVAYAGGVATFTPDAALNVELLHTAVVTGEVADLAGNTMGTSYIWSFSTEDGPDTTAPTIAATAPANGAENVEVDTVIQAHFSEPMDPLTLTTVSYYVQDALSNAVAGTVSYSDQVATFTPDAALQGSLTYLVTVTSAARDLAGNALAQSYTWAFETKDVAETQPPQVATVEPTANATGVAQDIVVRATFSEAIDPTTVSSSSFVLYDEYAGLVSASVGYDGTYIRLTPSASLQPSTLHTAIITTDVTDMAGNALAEDYTWSFTTEAGPDETPPTVRRVAPVDGVSNVEVDDRIMVWFSEAMDESTISETTFLVDDGSKTGVEGTVSYSSGQAIFTPSAALTQGTTYGVTLTTDIQDATGNALETNYAWFFATKNDAATQAPEVTATDPERGASEVPTDATITITFSEALDPTTVQSENIALYDADTQLLESELSYDGESVTLVPQSTLEPGALFTGVVWGEVADLAGNTMAANYFWTFTTDTGPDETPPQVTTTAPVADATDVEVDTAVQVYFSEPMDAATITTSTFLLDDGSKAAVTGTVAYAGQVATFTPASNLPENTLLTATITTGAQDVAGNALEADHIWSFTTTEVTETQPPSVVSTAPDGDATDVAVDTVISVTFSEPMNPSTLNVSTFTVYDAVTGVQSGTVAYDGVTATFTPTSGLNYDALHTVVLSGEVRDLAGNAMGSSYVWSFTTEPAPDVTPPEVASVLPTDGMTDVEVDAVIQVTFNEAMDESTVNVSTLLVDDGSKAAVTGTVTYADLTASFTPSAQLTPSTTYTVTVTTGAQDLSGNALASAYGFSFTTKATSDVGVPTVVSTVPAADAVDVLADSTITATFSEAMDPATMTAATFSLFDSTTGLVSGQVTCDGVTATFTPDTALTFGNQHTAVLSASVADVNGNTLGSSYVWTFDTEPGPDVTSPTVEATLPEDSATDLEVDVLIQIQFNEEMDPASLSDSTIVLDDGSKTPVAGTVTYADPWAVFTPSSNLTASTTYTVTVTTGVADVAGNGLAEDYAFSFTTGATTATNAPTVASTTPTDSAVGVAVDSSMSVTFSEPMDPASITAASIVLLDGSKAPVAGTVTFDGLTATFTPDSDLLYESTHVGNVTVDVKDLGGNALSELYVWSFTTEDPPDVTPPVVVSTSPSDGTEYVPLVSDVHVTFNEAMDPASLTTDTFVVLDPWDSPIAGTVTYEDNTATFSPASDFGYAAIYDCTITTGAADVAGNGLAANFSWSFMSTPDPADSFVHRVGSHLAVDAAHTPLLLRGVHFNTDDRSGSTISWPNHHYAADFQRVADLGMNCVRFALNYKTFEDDATPYTYRSAAWDWLDQNVTWARDNGLYLILVMYGPQGGYQGTEEGLQLWEVTENQNRLIALWTAIADRYKDEPTIAAYDLLNEPMPPTSVDQWETLANTLIAAIRTADTNHLIVLERCAGVFEQFDTYEDPDLTQFLVSDEKVVYDFHFYYPKEYTLQNLAYLGYGDGGAYPDATDAIYPSDTTWQGGTYENPSVSEGTTDWTYYEGKYTRVDDTTVFSGLPGFSCTANTGTVYFDDIVIEEYDEGLNFVQTVVSDSITSDENWSAWSSDEAGTFGLSTTDGHGDTTSLYISGATGACLYSNRSLRFTVTPGYYYRASAWMKGVSVSAGSTNLACARFETSPSNEPLLYRDKDYLEHMILRYLQFGLENGVPMNIGEFGLVQDCFDTGKGGETWMADVMDLFDKYGLNWTYYAYHNSDFGIYTGEELPDDTSARQELVDAFTGYFASASPVDTTAPDVQSKSPANGTLNVPVDTALTITFTEPMLASSITASDFSVTYYDSIGDLRELGLEVSYTDNTVTLIPQTYQAELRPNTVYTWAVSTGVVDPSMNALASSYEWSFTTAPGDASSFARTSSGQVVIGAAETPLTLQGIGFGNHVWSYAEHGTDLQYYHHTEASFDEVKTMGFNCIRFYLNYLSFEDDASPYVYKQEGWDWLDRNVAWASEHGVYLILNMHIPQGGFQGDAEGQNLWSVPANQERLIALWGAIAERYSNEPAIVGYGLVNEPTPPNSADEWQVLAQDIADEIRQYDDQHMLVVECIPSVYGEWYTAADPTQIQRLISDSNTMYEFHAYPPVLYTFQLTPYSEPDGGNYPDADIVECSWLEWAATNGGNPEVPEGDTDWAEYVGLQFQATDPEIVAGQPIFYADNNVGGTVYFDDFTVDEYDDTGAFVQTIRIVPVEGDAGWKNTEDQGLATFGLSTTEGYTDSVSLYIADATGFSQWYNPLFVFPTQQDYYYRISGWMKGVGVASGAECGMRIEFQKSTYGDPVFPRDITYLNYEVAKYAQFGIDNGVPMFVGEFGVSLPCFSGGKGGLFWVDDMLSVLDSQSLNFSFHVYNDHRFGVYWTEGQLPDATARNDDLVSVFQSFFGVK